MYVMKQKKYWTNKLTERENKLTVGLSKLTVNETRKRNRQETECKPQFFSEFLILKNSVGAVLKSLYELCVKISL
jgi:hypothetical protein